MMDSLLKRIENNRKAHTRWLAMILCLSMIVSLGTFAGFHKTAVAKTYTKEVLDCPYAQEGASPVAHVHNDDCYDGDTLVCTLPEREAHTHTEECFAEQRRLTCVLEENPGHQHGDACYAAREEITCGLEENPGHEHNGTCFNESGVLICGKEAGEGAHVHTADCFTTVYDLVCDIPEGEGAHTHTDECYTTERVQVCGQEELPVHVHGPECIRTVEWNEGEDEPVVTDEPVESAVPEMPVSDPDADLESVEDWNREFENLELSGNWARDLILVAATQQGRGESPNNFEAILNEAGDAWVRHGYTRYGAWYGVPYAEEWSAMFVSFCLRYAGIPEENVPNNPTAAFMAESFQKGELFAGRDYVPAVGDLIFFDTVDDEITNIDHMGIVYHVDAEDGTINTVEGDRTDAVATFGYHLDDEQIVGYGILPQNPNYIPTEENNNDELDNLIVTTEQIKETTVPAVPMPAQSWERTAGGIKVSVEAPEGAFPENTKIAVTPVNGNSLKDTVSDAVNGEVLEVQAVDITFFDADGHEIEPAVPIRVSMTPAATEHAEEKTSVVHVDVAQQTAELIEQAVGTEFDNSEVVFDADAFTIYAIVYTVDTYFRSWTGETFRVTMDFDENAGIPQNAELVVEEILEESADYSNLLSQTENALEGNKQISFVRFFDISIMADGKEVQPLAPVSMKIQLANLPEETTAADAQVIHFGNRPEVLTTEAAGANVSFETSSFSVYGVVYTVDFEYEVDGKVYTWSVPAAENIPLSDIIGGLNLVAADKVDTFLSRITSVASTNEEVVRVKEDRSVRVLKEGDAQLVISMQDGAVFSIEAKAEGETEVKTENAVISTLGDLYLPEEAKAEAKALDETASEAAIAAVQAEVGAAEDVAYQVFDIDLQGVDTDQFDGFQVSLILPEIVVGKDFHLYHIHDGNVEEIYLNTESRPAADIGMELVSGISFETENFSEFVLSYTVDFTYEGKTWHFPGRGIYDISELLQIMGIDVPAEGIESATVTLIEGEFVEGALYVENSEGQWYIGSDVPFSDTYELRVQIGERTYLITVTDAQQTTNLNELVTNFQLSGATPNGDGTYTVKPGKPYSVAVTFTESESSFQFSDTQEMVYSLPTGVDLRSINSPFSISVNYLGNNITINGNTAEIRDGKLYIKFNTNDSNYDKLKAISTTQITIHSTAVFDKNQSGKDIVIPGGGTYHVDGEPDVSIAKDGKITNFDSGKVEYTLKLTSNGSNNGVTIKDQLEGNALTNYDSNSIKLYKDGQEVTGTTVNVASDGKSFTMITGALEDGNYEIKYTANLDKSELTADGATALGKADDTKNSIYIDDKKVTDHSFNHVVEKKTGWKGAGSSTTASDGKATTPWTITAYTTPLEGGKLTTVSDEIKTEGTKYSGTGFDVKITDVVTGSVVAESVHVDWPSNKTDTSWSYDMSQLPGYSNTDGSKYWRYDIIYTTETDMSSASQSKQITNEGGPEDDKHTGTGTVYPPVENRTGIEKSVLSVGDNNEVTWRIKLTIPKLGVDKEKSYVIEHLPSSGSYKDTYVENSFAFVDGYAATEGQPTITTLENGDVKFSWDNGFNASDNQRTVIFTFRTIYDQNWIADEGATKYHQNDAEFNNDHSYAGTTYATPKFEKVGSKYIEENGEIYFDFDIKTNKITAGSFGENGDGTITFTDAFDSHLTYVEGSAKLYGSNDEYNIGNTKDSAVPTTAVSSEGNTLTFTVSKSMLPTGYTQQPDGSWADSGELYSYYRLHYRMKVVNSDELLSEALLLESLTVKMSNSITSTIGNSNTTVEFTPKVLEKWQSANLDSDTENHKGKVQFTIHVNESQLDLVEGEVLTLYDKLENISTAYQDIQITFPKGNYTAGQKSATIQDTGETVGLPYFNMKGDTITFYLPDGVDTLITYWSKPTGEVGPDGKIHYTNTAKLKNYEVKVEESAGFSGDASGLSTQYGVKLYKADGYVNSRMLAGAEFKLFMVDEEDENGNILSGTPMKDGSGNDKIFTSRADGVVNIEGDSSTDGWNLKPEQRYYLLEVKAPEGMAVDTTKYSFIISAKGYTNYSRNSIVAPDGSGAIVEPWTYYNGDILTVKNWPKDGELEITKNFDQTGDIQSYAQMTQDQKSAIKFEVYQKQKDDTWKLFKTIGFDQFTTDSNGVPKFTVGDLTAGEYKVIEIVDDSACTEQTYEVTAQSDVAVNEGNEPGYVTVVISKEDITNHTSHAMSVTNKYENESEFKIYKYANRGIEGKTDIRLAGAEFAVYTTENGTATENKVGDNYQTNGRGIFTIKPSAGDEENKVHYDTLYALKEEKAPDGYQKSDSVTYFYFVSENSTAPTDLPADTVVIVGYKQSETKNIPNDIGTTSVGAKKIWQNDKLEEDTTKANTAVEVKIKQVASLDKDGKNIVSEETKYYPTDDFLFTVTKSGESWNLSKKDETATLPDGVTITNGRLTGMPKMKITDNGIALYYHYVVEEIVPGGYTATYTTETDAVSGDTTVTITNRPSSVQSFVKLQAEKKWVNAEGEDITSSMGVEDGVTVDVYRKEGIVKEGVIYEKNGTQRDTADLFTIAFVEGNGRQGSAVPVFSQSLITCLPNDEIEIIVTAPSTKSFQSSFVDVTTAYLKPDGNYEREQSLAGVADSANYTITYNYTATGNNNAIRVVAKSDSVQSLTVEVNNKTANGRTQVLTQLDAEAVGGDPVQSLQLNKANNWRAESNEFSGGNGSTVYTYYLVERNGCNFDAKYTVEGDKVVVTNTDKRLRVDKKWFRPDGTTEIDQEDGDIVYNLYRVARPVNWVEGDDAYSGTGNLKVDLSELQFVDTANNSKKVTLSGNYTSVNKIKAGSKVQIEITTSAKGSEELNEKYNWDGYQNVSTFSISGGTLVSNQREDTTGQQEYKRTIVVGNVNSVLKLRGGLISAENATITVNVKVLGEYQDGEVPTGDALTQTRIAQVTMSSDNVSVVWDLAFEESGIQIKPDKEKWSSVISRLPETGPNGETYSYYVTEESVSLNSFVFLSIDNNNATAGETITIKNKAKPAKVRVTKAFSGVEELPNNFRITNGVNDTVFTVSNKAGGNGTAADPYYWELENLTIGQQVTFYEWNFGVEGKEMTVTDMNGNEINTPYRVTVSAVETISDSSKTTGVGGFVNNYGEKLGSLKLKKIVQVNGEDNGTSTLTDGTYTFTIKKAGEETTGEQTAVHTVTITYAGGKVTEAKLASSTTLTADEDGFYEVKNLEPGDYVITETLSSDSKAVLSSVSGGKSDGNLTNHTITVTVVAGQEGTTVADAGKATFTNNVYTFEFTKIWKDLANANQEWVKDITVTLHIPQTTGGTASELEYQYTISKGTDGTFTVFPGTSNPDNPTSPTGTVSGDKDNGYKVTFTGLISNQDAYVTETKVNGYNSPSYMFMATDGKTLTPKNATNSAVLASNGEYIVNTPEGGYELPQTGGMGTGIFTSIGALLSGTAGAILMIRKRKQTA